MTEHKTQSSEQSKKMATRTILVVIAFVLVVAGIIAVLEAVANKMEHDGVFIEYTPSSEPFYVLLIGNDSRKETALYTGKANEHAQLDQHTDIATLMRVDPSTYTITFITVPRDTYIDEMGMRVTDTLVSGDPMDSVRAVEILTGERIPYYMMTTFTGFHDLIDALGGIEVDVPLTVSEKDPVTSKAVTVKKGENRSLNGSESLVLARSRKSYEGSQDALRQVNVRNIEESMLSKVLNSGYDMTDLLLNIQSTTTTNMNYSLIDYMIKDFIENKDQIVIYSCTGPYEGDINENDIWVVNEDKESWAQIIELANRGEDPASVVLAPVFTKN